MCLVQGHRQEFRKGGADEQSSAHEARGNFSTANHAHALLENRTRGFRARRPIQGYIEDLSTRQAGSAMRTALLSAFV